MADFRGDIYDASGRLQVSTNMLGMVCRRTGTGATITRQGGNTSPSSLLVDVSGCSYPVVAIKIDNYVAALAGKSGNSTTNHWICSAPVGTGFTYYIFDWTTSLPNSGGMERRFDANGRCTFNSDYFPMFTTRMFGGVGQTMATNGRVFATAQGTMAGHSRRGEALCYQSGGPQLDPDGGGLQNCRDIRYRNDGKLYGGGVRPGDGTVGMYQVSWDDVQVSAGNYTNYSQNDVRGWECPGTVMAVDVTNIPVGATFF
ncbi:hypothetical protein [Sphingomonas sp. Leaf242]|uniref:hypothetical protein n=1 Tax=Sphingomonas sp. Leaf242 TaxID=1736304 RepID=UPI000ABAF3FA|nr:hypothetical protein [Sphingomonas sp. Leaf242]